MVKINEADAHVPMGAQLEETGDEPVTLINVFGVAPEEVDALMTAWTDDAHYYKGQPGFISAQLYRGIAGSTTFQNIATWESVGHFRAAFTNPVFREKLARYPGSATISPHLFRKVAVPGVCVT